MESLCWSLEPAVEYNLKDERWHFIPPWPDIPSLCTAPPPGCRSGSFPSSPWGKHSSGYWSQSHHTDVFNSLQLFASPKPRLRIYLIDFPVLPERVPVPGCTFVARRAHTCPWPAQCPPYSSPTSFSHRIMQCFPSAAAVPTRQPGSCRTLSRGTVPLCGRGAALTAGDSQGTKMPQGQSLAPT